MKIAILSRRKEIYSTRRLVQAAGEQGHTAIVLDPLKCHILLDSGVYRVYYRGEPLERVDVVLPRIGASVTEYGLAVVRQFEMMGAPIVNTSRAIARSRDKLRCLQILADQEIPIPKTFLCRSPRYVKRAIDLVGGLPVILKLQQGTQGVGVILADSYQSAESTLDALWSLGQNILIQEYISESAGTDLRILVIGGRVVAAMKRVAQSGEFRANIHRGARGVSSRPTPEQERVALRAAKVLGLSIAGVDLGEGKDRTILMEVNSSPGLRGLEKATELDIASEIVRHVASYASSAASSAVRYVGDAHAALQDGRA
jgi:ribosomal protein S6--L-glutamate ligase